MKTFPRFGLAALWVVPLLALAPPARGDTTDDLRRSNHAWVERLDFTAGLPFGPVSRSRTNVCDLVGKAAGDLAVTVNLRDFGLAADARFRLAGAVQREGFIRWTVDPASVPRRAGEFDIRSLTGSIDTDVRAIGPFEADCGGVTRTYRVRLDLRPGGAGRNTLVVDAGLVTGTVPLTVTRFAAEFATPARAPLTLAGIRLAASTVRAVAGVETRVNGWVSVTAEPDGRTYDVALAVRGTPAAGAIRVTPPPRRFDGRTLEQGFALIAPIGYVGTVEVTATGSDGAVRRAAVRITAPGVDLTEVIIPPEGLRVFKWEHLPDPPPDVLRQAGLVGRKPLAPEFTVRPDKAGRPVPQEPFKPKAAPRPPEKREPRKIPPPAKGRG